MRSDEFEMWLPGSHRHMFQGNQGNAIDVQRTKGRRAPLGVSRTVTHILEREPPLLRLRSMTSMMYLQETIHFLRDFRCQLGLGNRGWFTPPIFRSHLYRWSDQGSEDELLSRPAGPRAGNQETRREHC